MNIVVVANTQMTRGTVCIGAIADSSPATSLRMLNAKGAYHALPTAYTVGTVWDLTWAPATTIVPPHVEDVHIHSAKQIGALVGTDLVQWISSTAMPVGYGSPAILFGGLVGWTSNHSGYISAARGLPPFSTQFWVPDRELKYEDNKYYVYRDDHHIQYRLPYKGLQTPLASIANGSFLRISLARWWPTDQPDREPRCYLQLSGWF